MCTILAVFKASLAVPRKAWKFRPERGFKPWLVRYRCSAPPVELSGLLGAGRWEGRPYVRRWVGLITQLVEHCTSVAEVRFESKFGPEFFRPFSRLLNQCSKLWGSNTFMISLSCPEWLPFGLRRGWLLWLNKSLPTWFEVLSSCHYAQLC